jgi:sulfite oxidase
VRNIKWVKRITLSTSESPLTWHKRDYRLFSPNDSLTNVNFEEREPVYDMPVQSVICSPLDSTSFDSKNENVNFKGFAYSGGGRGIVRVELTTDHGESWIETQLEKRQQRLGRRWSWAFWNADIPASDIEKEICVRAIDDAGHGQPESLKSIWNYRGLLTNSWHCIHLTRK